MTINDNMIRFVFQGKVGVAALWKVKPRRRGGWKSREEALGDPVKGKCLRRVVEVKSRTQN